MNAHNSITPGTVCTPITTLNYLSACGYKVLSFPCSLLELDIPYSSKFGDFGQKCHILNFARFKIGNLVSQCPNVTSLRDWHVHWYIRTLQTTLHYADHSIYGVQVGLQFVLIITIYYYIALFPGRLPLCFLDRIRDLWTARFSRQFKGHICSQENGVRQPGNEANLLPYMLLTTTCHYKFQWVWPPNYM